MDAELMGPSLTIGCTLEEMHDFLDRSGEVFAYGDLNSHGWRDPIRGILRLIFHVD